MEIVVSDTNIFIDLSSVGLLEQFFDLPVVIHTVDFVINEITDKNQQTELDRFVLSGKLHVKEFNETETQELMEMYYSRNNNISVTDCSVWYYAKKNNYRLLTGDRKLKHSAVSDGVQVSGILYVTDMLVECELIQTNDMVNKLTKLMSINTRLPKGEIEKRIKKYNEQRQ